MDDRPTVDAADDLVLLLAACSARLDDEVLTRVRADLGDDIRFRDGYVFQHLVPGPCSISELARRLGVTQQAASKQVADLVDRGLVTKAPDPDDARAWLVSLSDRGRRAVEAGRLARTAIASELGAQLGAGAMRSLLGHLRDLSERTDALPRLLDRQLRPEESR